MPLLVMLKLHICMTWDLFFGQMTSFPKHDQSRGDLGWQVVLVVKNPSANAGDLKDAGLIPGSGRSPGGRHGNPLQYSCLENTTGRGAWWTTVREVAKSQTRLK